MKAYITKYLFTQGIIELNGYLSETDSNYFISKKGGWGRSVFSKNDWHETRELAVKRAQEMQKKKIKAIERTINKIKAMTFE